MYIIGIVCVITIITAITTIYTHTYAHHYHIPTSYNKYFNAAISNENEANDNTIPDHSAVIPELDAMILLLYYMSVLVIVVAV